MADLLDRSLSNLVPGLQFQCIPHQGKKDLHKSIPRKLRAWKEPGIHFVVLQDQDEGDCRKIKEDLLALCHEGGRSDSLVRIVCRELEAWYLGIPESLADAFSIDRKSKAIRNLKKPKYARDPDTVAKPSGVIERSIPDFTKGKAARRMAAYISKDNPSKSLRVLIDGVEKLVGIEAFSSAPKGDRRSLAGSGHHRRKRDKT